MSEIPEKTGFASVDAKAAEYRSGPTNSTDQNSLSTPAPDVRVQDLLVGKSAAERKTYPLYEGVIGYFKNALYRVAHVSWVGNNQHNPGQPLHWARGKSKDQMDCLMRHAAEYDPNDFSAASEEAGAAMCWRALAEFEIYLERKYGLMPPKNARSDD